MRCFHLLVKLSWIHLMATDLKKPVNIKVFIYFFILFIYIIKTTIFLQFYQKLRFKNQDLNQDLNQRNFRYEHIANYSFLFYLLFIYLLFVIFIIYLSIPNIYLIRITRHDSRISRLNFERIKQSTRRFDSVCRDTVSLGDNQFVAGCIMTRVDEHLK